MLQICKSYPNCFADLQRHNQAARSRAFRKLESPLERSHLVSSRVAESGEGTRARAEEFVAKFYDWMDSDNGADLSQTIATDLLRYLADEPRLVTVLELTTKCFLHRVAQEKKTS
jgi:hypothetical protein